MIKGINKNAVNYSYKVGVYKAEILGFLPQNSGETVGLV